MLEDEFLSKVMGVLFSKYPSLISAGVKLAKQLGLVMLYNKEYERVLPLLTLYDCLCKVDKENDWGKYKVTLIRDTK